MVSRLFLPTVKPLLFPPTRPPHHTMNHLQNLPLYASLIPHPNPSSTLNSLRSLPLLLSSYISNLSQTQLWERLLSTLVNFHVLEFLLRKVRGLSSHYNRDGIGSRSSSKSQHFHGLELIILAGTDLYGPLLSYFSLAISIILQQQQFYHSDSITIYGTVFSSLLIWVVISWALYYFGCIVWLQRRRMQWHEVLCLVGYQLFSIFVINGLLGWILSEAVLGMWWSELLWFGMATIVSLSSSWSIGSVLMSESDEMVLPLTSNGVQSQQNKEGGFIALGLVTMMQFFLVLWLRYAIQFIF